MASTELIAGGHNDWSQAIIKPAQLCNGSHEVRMAPLKLPAMAKDPLSPLQYNLTLLANLIYLARRSESGQQQRYLDWASGVIEEMQRYLRVQK